MSRFIFVAYAILIRIIFILPVALVIGFYRTMVIPRELEDHWTYGELVEDVMDELADGSPSYYRKQLGDL